MSYSNMSYSKGVFGGIAGATDERPPTPAAPAPHRAVPTAARAEGNATASASSGTIVVRQPADGSVPVALSFVTPDCIGRGMSATYKPMDRTGIVKAGTPIVGARKISWNPAIVGADFPRSWMTLRNGEGTKAQQEIDAETRDMGATGTMKTAVTDNAVLAAIVNVVTRGAIIESPMVAPAVQSGGHYPGNNSATLTYMQGLINDWGLPVDQTFHDMWKRIKARAAQSSELATRLATKRAVGLPASSTEFLTPDTKVFLIGFTPLASNEGVLYAGAVSTRPVSVEKMQYMLKRILHTPRPVAGGNIHAFAEVPVDPPGKPRGVSVNPNSVSYPERLSAQFSLSTAGNVATQAAIDLLTDLHTIIQGGIFGSMAVQGSQRLVIPGEEVVQTALAAIATAPDLASLPSVVATATGSLVAEAETATSIPPADGDKACADILQRLVIAQTALANDLDNKRGALVAGPAALLGAQVYVRQYATSQRVAEATIMRQVNDKIAAYEATPGMHALTPGEKQAVHCYLLNAAAPVIAASVAVAQPRADAIAAIDSTAFAANAASAAQAYAQALESANAAFAAATARVEAIRKQIALDWYLRSWHGLPVWAWGAGAAAVLIGGVVVVRVMRKKSAAAVAK